MLPTLTATSSPTFQSPLNSTSVANQTYILALASHKPSASYALALSAPALHHQLSLRDPHTLTEKRSWQAHSSGISQLKSIHDGLKLFTSGKDGSIHQWDDRSKNGIALSMTSVQNRPILAFDCASDGHLIAGGTELRSEEAFILYWDLRSPSTILHTHASTHSDDITNLVFIPSTTTSLLSTSTDGLLCISDPREDDEDESVLQVFNWGTSVSKASFLLNHAGKPDCIWASSDMETFATWNMELDILHDFSDLRNPRASLPISSSSSRDWKMDYLVDVLDPFPDYSPFILGGTNNGHVGLIELPTRGHETSPWTWTLHSVLNGHDGIVRCAMWDKERNVIVTGGEDSQLSVWQTSALSQEMQIDDDSEGRFQSQRKRDFDGDSESSRNKKVRTSS